MSPTELVATDKNKVGKAPSATWVFFQRWMADPVSMGSILPSSPALRNLVSKNVLCGPDQIVVEFGGGTGSLTRAILEAGVPPERVCSIEIDRELVDYMERAHPQVWNVHGDAREADTLIGEEWVGKVGTVMVGIPMVMLSFRLQKEIVDSIFRILAPGGRFLQFTYCITCPLPREKLGLKGERLGFTPLNFPPASLWGYTRADET